MRAGIILTLAGLLLVSPHASGQTAGAPSPRLITLREAVDMALQRNHVVRLAGLGARVLLSNSVAPDIRKLYADNREAKAVGLKARTVAARRAINSRASRRGAVREYLITNIV